MWGDRKGLMRYPTKVCKQEDECVDVSVRDGAHSFLWVWDTTQRREYYQEKK